MLAAYLAAVAALGLLTLLPGPDAAIVLRFAVSGGWPAAARSVLGIVTGLALWGTLTAAGLAAVLAASATLYLLVKVAGAIFLVWLGARALWHSRTATGTAVGPAVGELAPRRARPFRSGLLTNLLNPKIAVFYTGLLPSLVPPGASAHRWLPLLVATHVVLSLAWLLAYAAMLSRSRAVLERPRVKVVLERVTGCVLVGFGLRVAAEAR